MPTNSLQQTQKELESLLLSNLRSIKDYPKKGIMFRDITTILGNGECFRNLIDFLRIRYEDKGLTHIVGIESRGFVFGSALAYALGISFVPIRKKGKLPCKTYKQDYALEYGSDTLEIHIDAFCPSLDANLQPSKNNAPKSANPPLILLVDDLLATGGTANASISLIKKAGGQVLESCFLIALKSEFSPKLDSPSFALLEL